MSNSSHTHTAKEPSDRRVFFAAIGWLGVIALFALIVFIAYLPNRAESFYEENTAQRKAIRQETVAAQKQLTENFSWENQNDGVVRLPLTLAMELTVAELKTGKDQ